MTRLGIAAMCGLLLVAPACDWGSDSYTCEYGRATETTDDVNALLSALAAGPAQYAPLECDSSSGILRNTYPVAATSEARAALDRLGAEQIPDPIPLPEGIPSLFHVKGPTHATPLAVRFSPSGRSIQVRSCALPTSGKPPAAC